jgi:hypothetical protein
MRYSNAVVVHIHPVTLISEGGGMLWRSTIYEGCVVRVGRASPEAFKMALDRWEDSRDEFEITYPGKPAFFQFKAPDKAWLPRSDV